MKCRHWGPADPIREPWEPKVVAFRAARVDATLKEAPKAKTEGENMEPFGGKKRGGRKH